MYVEENFGGKEDTFVYYAFMLDAVTAQCFIFIVLVFFNLKKSSIFVFRDSLTATEKKRFIYNPKRRRWKETSDGAVPTVRRYVTTGEGFEVTLKHLSSLSLSLIFCYVPFSLS